MKRICAFAWVVVFGSALQAQTIDVRGRVSNGAGQPVAGAVVELAQQGLKDTTGSDGAYSIVKPGVSLRPNTAAPRENITLENGILEFTVGGTTRLNIEVFDLSGNLLEKESLQKAQPGVYQLNVENRPHSKQMLFIQASMGPHVRIFRYFPSKQGFPQGISSMAGPRSAGGMLVKTAAAVDTLKVSAAGRVPKKIGLSSYDTTVNVALDTMSAGGVPKVTPSIATTIPALYGNPVANPGKFTTNVSYQVYWYSANAPSSEAFRSTPGFQKQTTPKTKFYNVYLPPNYDAQKEYPLIIIMHGITDNPNMWIDRSNPKINVVFDNLITSNATKPFIAVFAAGTVDNAQGGYYAFGAELMNELLPLIESKYPVRKDRGSRAMAGFSFGGMQTLSIGLCAHLKEFAWFAGLHAAGPPTPNSADIAKYVAAQDPETYPLYYLYLGTGTNDTGAGSSSANGLATKGPHITTANFSWQNNLTGTGGGSHNYMTAQVGLYNFLRMAFSPNY